MEIPTLIVTKMELKRIEEFFDLLSIKRTRTNGDENELKRIQELLEENNEELVADSSDNTLDLANAKHPENGQTPLMYVAMETGDSRVVQVLLEFGAKWNECDEDGHCAGEYAARAGFNELAMMLMDYGVECELELSRLEREKGEYVTDTSYLKEKIVYDGEDRLLDQQGDAVMMKWETPLMKIHAERICEKCGRDAVVMNVGFGLGIVDGFIQDLEPKKHVIIEAHPDVYQHMIRKGWDKKENVDIRFGRWQDVIDDIANEYEFTGIFFDTYGESYDEIREFHEHLPKLMSKNDKFVYSYFNGFCPDNVFFHMVYNKLIARELNELANLETKFERVKVEKIDWTGVSGHGKYWDMETYFLPTCTLKLEEEDKDKN